MSHHAVADASCEARERGIAFFTAARGGDFGVAGHRADGDRLAVRLDP